MNTAMPVVGGRYAFSHWVRYEQHITVGVLVKAEMSSLTGHILYTVATDGRTVRIPGRDMEHIEPADRP